MKKKLLTLALATVLMSSPAFMANMAIAGEAVATSPQTEKQWRNQQADSQESGAEIKSKVAAILSQYNAATLTAAQAKAINNAFRKAGVRRGAAQKQAILAAGFNPEKIRSLDPPPEKPQRSRSDGK